MNARSILLKSPSARARVATTLLLLTVCLGAAPGGQTRPPVQDLNSPRVFPLIDSQREWTVRAKTIREQALASCGLSPMPTKTPLGAKVFARVERDGYSVEKAYFQSYPGFFVAGNLYRPLGHGAGPFPGILNPHGHWANGRLTDQADGSVAARCIHFARHGMVAFSYDMAGYNDTFFPDHASVAAPAPYARHRWFGTNRTDQLWNISLMGLQAWNSVRALDFLESLPDVDSRRLACTGESGGGTQTFMLGAIDDRLAVQAPVVMVSSIMQGGCSCENAPGLRVRYSNMEIAAAPAPRPQFLVAATGDWTRYTLSVEGPSIKHIYQLLGAGDRFDYVRYDFGHNYNQKSREAVYGWFNKWLLKADSSAPVPEVPYTKEPDSELRVFPNNKLPSAAVSENELVGYLKESAQKRWEALLPRDRAGLENYRSAIFPGWAHVLQTSRPGQSRIGSSVLASDGTSALMTEVEIWDEDEPDHRIALNVTRPAKRANRRVAVLATSNPEQLERDLASMRAGLLNQGWTVVLLKTFGKTDPVDVFANFYTTYNRTRAQQGAADLVTVCDYARSRFNPKKLVLCGNEAAGLWALLAAPAADIVVSDCRRLSVSSDDALLHEDVFCPGLRCIGGLEGAALMAAPHPLYLHNMGDSFATARLELAYDDLNARGKLETTQRAASPREIMSWLLRLK